MQIGCLTGLAQVALAQASLATRCARWNKVQKFADEGLTGNLGKTMRIPLGWPWVLAGDVAAARCDLEEGVRLREGRRTR